MPCVDKNANTRHMRNTTIVTFMKFQHKVTHASQDLVNVDLVNPFQKGRVMQPLPREYHQYLPRLQGLQNPESRCSHSQQGAGEARLPAVLAPRPLLVWGLEVLCAATHPARRRMHGGHGELHGVESCPPSLQVTTKPACRRSEHSPPPQWRQ